MITIHHLETSRSQRILWLLEELGLPYELVTYRRDGKTRLAPPELRRIHPLGKSPVITDGAITVAESGAILEYLAATYAARGEGELGQLDPAPGTPEWLQVRYWMHFAEGSLMNWLVMKLVFMTIPSQPMPFFARPIARQLCAQVQRKLVDPNIASALQVIESQLSQHRWFAGEHLTLADFQMSFPVEAAFTRAARATELPCLRAYRDRMHARPAYQRAIARGGPVLMDS
jgi:glutathione S-transferase